MIKKTFTQDIFSLSCPWDNAYQGRYDRVLFVCSAGLLRSATAATLGSKLGLNTRNCGSHMEYALVPISVNLVFWAHKIVFVNQENYDRALDLFFGDKETQNLIITKGVVWNIEDNYEYMSPTLVSIMEPKIKDLFVK